MSHKGLFHLSVVYVVWSTTYLAMRVGVNPGERIVLLSRLARCAWLSRFYLLSWLACRE